MVFDASGFNAKGKDTVFVFMVYVVYFMFLTFIFPHSLPYKGTNPSSTMDLIKDINELVPLGKPTAETSLEEERLLEESTREIGASKDVPLDVSSNYQIPPSLRVDLTQLEMDLNMELGREQKGAMEEDTAEEEEEDTATDGDRKISAVDTTREKEALMERVRGLETASDVTNFYNVAIRDGMHLELINKADLKCVRDNAGSLAFMKATSGLETAQG